MNINRRMYEFIHAECTITSIIHIHMHRYIHVTNKLFKKKNKTKALVDLIKL